MSNFILLLFIFLGSIFIISILINIIKSLKKTMEMLSPKAAQRRKNLETIFWSSVGFTFFILFKTPLGAIPYLFKTVFALLSLYACCLVFVFFRALRAIEDTPTAHIRSAIQGYVELEGKAKIDPNNLLYAPLTKRPCVWYQYSIKENGSKSISLIKEDKSKALIILQDETGECFIDTEKAEINFTMPSTIWHGATEYPETVPIDGSFSKKGVTSGRYIYEEKVLLPDEKLYAIGMFRTLKSDIIKNRNKALAIQEYLKQWKADYQTLLQKFDVNQDGKLSEEEWNKIIEAAENEIKLKYPDSPSSAENKEVVHLLSNLALPKGKPFILSNLKQSRLIITYKARTWLYALLFIGFAVWSLNFSWPLH